MSLRQPALNPWVLAHLYTDPLFEPRKDPSLGSNAPIPFLGDNRQHILILVEHTPEPFLPDDLLEFLIQVLGACQLSMSDVALVNRQHLPGLRYVDLQHQFQPAKILAFGTQLQDSPLPKAPWNEVQFVDQCSWLHSASLGELKDDKSLKIIFWKELKSLFNL